MPSQRSLSSQRWRKSIPVLHAVLPYAVLLVQNLVIFAHHYWNDFGFAGDFPRSYYGVVAFWTMTVQRGLDPQWIPFQAMGYPFALQMQSGFYYPPLWLFPLFHIPYTLHAAVVFSVLHVFVGAVGMFLFLKAIFKSPYYALIGAFAFQCFGGFYTNARHVDIIHAFALTPWLLYVLTFETPQPLRLPRRILLLPPLIYLLATGGYPGNFISGIAICGIYVFSQIVDALLHGTGFRQLLRLGGSIAGLALLGLVMATANLGPAIVYRDLLLRYNLFQETARVQLSISQLPAIFLSTKTVLGAEPRTIILTSPYVTLPMILLASFVPLRRLEQRWPLVLMGILGLLMVTGDQSSFWVAVTTLVPPLRFSRMSSTDYSLFIAIPIFVFALFGLQALLRHEIDWRSALARAFLALLGMGICVYVAYKGEWNWNVFWVLLVASASVLLLFILWRRQPTMSFLVVTGLLLLLSLDAARVLPDLDGWRLPEISSYYEKQGWPYQTNGQLVTYSILDRLPSSRPARTLPPVSDFDWGGYIDGRYLLGDKAGAIGFLMADKLVRGDKVYEQYMRMPWTPILLDAGSIQASTSQVELASADVARALTKSAEDPTGTVTQMYYGVDNINYKLSLSRPTLLVENEIYFPGWEADLNLTDGTRHVQAIAVNQAFRGWLLPAGDYQMKAHFQLPGLAIYRLISLAAFVLWAALVVIAFARPGPRQKRDQALED